MVHGRSLHDVVARAQHDLQHDVEGRRQRQHDEDEERGRAARGRTQHTGAADTGRIAGVARRAQDAAAVGRARKSFTERTLSVDGTADSGKVRNRVVKNRRAVKAARVMIEPCGGCFDVVRSKSSG